MKVILPILHHTDGTADLSELDLDWSFADCEERDVVFYDIAGLSQKFEDGIWYTLVHTNGIEYVTAMDIQKVMKLIDKSI